MQKNILLIPITILFILTILGSATAATSDEVTNAIVTPNTQPLVNSNTTSGGNDQFVVYNTPAQGFPTNGSSYANINSGNLRGNTANLRLNLTIPQGAQTLSFDWRFASNDYPPFADWATVEINDGTSTRNILLLPNNNPVNVDNAYYTYFSPTTPNDIGYNRITPMYTTTADVSSFAGRTIILSFSVANALDTIGTTALFIDNLHIGPVSDLSITKAVNNTNPSYGSTIEYLLNATNNGPDAASNVIVTDSIPAGLQFISTDGAYDSSTGIWTIGNLGVGETALLKIIAFVNATGEMTNIATITGNVYDPDTLNNSGNATINIPATADLYLTKLVDNAKPKVKDIINFTLIVNNLGPDTAVDVQVNDKLPAGLRFLRYTANYGTYDPVTGIWTIGDLPNGARAVLTITSVVENSGNIINEANVTSLTYDPNLEGNTATAIVNAQAVVNAATEDTVGMQETGLPLAMLVMAILAVLGGFIAPKRK